MRHFSFQSLIKSLCLITAVACVLYYALACSLFDVHDDVIIAVRLGDGNRARRLAGYDMELSRTGFEEHMTPLGAAAWMGDVETVRFLLRKGVDVHSKDDHGKTALYLARHHGELEIARLLVQAGARY